MRHCSIQQKCFNYILLRDFFAGFRPAIMTCRSAASGGKGRLGTGWRLPFWQRLRQVRQVRQTAAIVPDGPGNPFAAARGARGAGRALRISMAQGAVPASARGGVRRGERPRGRGAAVTRGRAPSVLSAQKLRSGGGLRPARGALPFRQRRVSCIVPSSASSATVAW